MDTSPSSGVSPGSGVPCPHAEEALVEEAHSKEADAEEADAEEARLRAEIAQLLGSKAFPTVITATRDPQPKKLKPPVLLYAWSRLGKFERELMLEIYVNGGRHAQKLALAKSQGRSLSWADNERFRIIGKLQQSMWHLHQLDGLSHREDLQRLLLRHGISSVEAFCGSLDALLCERVIGEKNLPVFEKWLAGEGIQPPLDERITLPKDRVRLKLPLLQPP